MKGQYGEGWLGKVHTIVDNLHMPESGLYFQELEMNDFAAIVRYSNGGYRQGGSSLTIFDAPELGNNFYLSSSMALMDRTVL